jgi:hypothetical protein
MLTNFPKAVKNSTASPVYSIASLSEENFDELATAALCVHASVAFVAQLAGPSANSDNST